MNPYLYLRKASKLSQRGFCDKYDFAKQTIISVEQGVYAKLSQRMVDAMADACTREGLDIGVELTNEYGTSRLPQAYALWQKHARENLAPAIARYNPTTWTQEQSPMDFFMLQTTGSVQGFAKAVKVQSSTLLRYARGEQLEMPTTLLHALREAKFTHLDRLIKVQADWTQSYV